jgi:hypothetical protein
MCECVQLHVRPGSEPERIVKIITSDIPRFMGGEVAVRNTVTDTEKKPLFIKLQNVL